MIHTQPHARVRRGAIALVAAFMGLFLSAAPASAASNTWVGVGNGGPDPLLVSVTAGPGLTVNLRSGCGDTPPLGVTFAVCLPGGAFLAFSTDLTSATD